MGSPGSPRWSGAWRSGRYSRRTALARRFSRARSGGSRSWSCGRSCSAESRLEPRPRTTGVLMKTALISFASLLVFSSLRARSLGAQDRQVLHGPGEVRGLPFSMAVRVGNMLYLSGQIGNKPGTRELADTGIAGQKRLRVDVGRVHWRVQVHGGRPQVLGCLAGGHPEIEGAEGPRPGRGQQQLQAIGAHRHFLIETDRVAKLGDENGGG